MNFLKNSKPAAKIGGEHLFGERLVRCSSLVNDAYLVWHLIGIYIMYIHIQMYFSNRNLLVAKAQGSRKLWLFCCLYHMISFLTGLFWHIPFIWLTDWCILLNTLNCPLIYDSQLYDKKGWRFMLTMKSFYLVRQIKSDFGNLSNRSQFDMEMTVI